MKKAFKWTLIIFGSLIILILAAAFIVPVLFKDDIKAAIDKEIAKSVNADVVFDVDKFNLTLFKNFPNVTIELGDLGVINREPFEGQVLFATNKLQVEINLKDILFGDQLRVKGISLVKPVINVKVLPDGKANWDIAIPSTDTVSTEEPGEFSFGIDHWEIVDGDVVYDDQSLPYYLQLKGLNHSGSGDFTQDVFDLKTQTVADTVTTSYDGVEYISNKRVEIDAVISISEEYSKYTFKENSATVNDFAMSFDGWFKMNENDYDMDISFASPENSFKSLLSLVPGMYTESFEKIETTGDLSFKGFVKGKFSDNAMPAFNVNLKVADAMFKYPDLPTAVNNINVDLVLDNPDGVIENTIVDLKKLHLDFGSNPVDARALITRIYPTNVDASVNAKLNLAELGKMFPMEGLEMKGSYAVNLNAKGVYDSLKKIIPAIDATMSLSDGYVKSAEFPMPLHDLAFHSTIKNSSGKMAETVVTVKNFTMVLDDEKFNADLLLQNLDDYNWDLNANGGIDLEKMTKVFPLEGMTLAGKVKADIHTKGKYSDLAAERYEKLPTSGTASLKDFKYTSKDLPYAVTIGDASMVFDPRKIELKKMDGTIGRSDFSVNGAVMNYLGFALGKNETVKGTVNFNSTLLDLNEFMTDTEETPSAEDTTSYGVIPVPENVDFVLKSSIKTTKLMDYTISNASGDIVVKDGIARLDGLKFNMLGGAFTVSGAYNTKDIAHPAYDFTLKIDGMSIQQAAASFSVVQTYAPIAGFVNGNFSTDFKISGELGQDMMPKMGTINGDGLVKVAKAALKESKLISGITSLTKLENTNEVTMKDVLMSASINNGRLSVKPFDVKLGDYKTAVAGSTGLDGSIDYTLKMNVPAGKMGSQLQGFINKNTGSNNPTDEIPVTIALGNTFTDPKFQLVAAEQKQQVKEAVTNVAKEEGKKAVQEAVKGTEAEKLLQNVLGNNTQKKDSARGDSTTKTSTSTTPTAEDLKKKAEEEAKKKIQNLLKKRN